MRLMFSILCALLLFAGCGVKKEKSAVAVKLGKMNITVDQLSDVYKNSLWVKSEGAMSKEEFVDAYIKRRLLLLEARKYGLDREEDFLNSVEHFWQQSLLKMVIDKKISELSSSIVVDESELKKYYEEHKNDFNGLPFEQCRDNIKFLLQRTKQQKALEAWMENLSENVEIEIDSNIVAQL